MRVTKEPEVRKQEILDTALKLFGENGYEKTSITDIAKAIGVAQGLCYRYFPSKEARRRPARIWRAPSASSLNTRRSWK